MDLLTAIGIIAGTLTTASFFPQVFKAWKTKHTKDVSGAMFLILFFGIALWLVYGFYLKDLPLIASNTVSIMLVGIMLFLKKKYG